jgi:hypothetical protein
MPWPDPLGRLLTRADSRAAQALRWGLSGLRASLQAAVAEAPDDPGAADLRELLGELDSLLVWEQATSSCRTDWQSVRTDCQSVLQPDLDPSRDRTSATAGPVLPSDGAGDRPASSPRLRPLARALAADARLLAELSRSPVRDGSDDEIWNDVHRLLLRVPPVVAEEWRRRSLKQAEQAGGRADETAVAVVPLGRDEPLYPGLTGDIRAAGLRAGVALDPRAAPPAEGDLRALAGVASACLWFIEHDPHLCHCLRNVFRFGITPLTGEQRERYVAELLRLWERLRTGAAQQNVGQDSNPVAYPAGLESCPTGLATASRSQTTAGRPAWKDWLKTCLDFDEAIHSLVYQPPVAPTSWWGRLQGQAREVLFRMRDRAVGAGCPVHLQALGGSFADISRLAPDSLQVDFGVPGEVAVCLRVWARLDGEEVKGRVLYRSPQEEP